MQVGLGILCFKPASPLARQVHVGLKHPAAPMSPPQADLLCKLALMASSPCRRGLACDPQWLSMHGAIPPGSGSTQPGKRGVLVNKWPFVRKVN